MEEVKPSKLKHKKYLMQVIVGMLFGFFGAIFGLEIIDNIIDPQNLKLSIELIISGTVAIIYFIIGLIVFISLLLPRKHSVKFLNLEDEEELAEQKQILWGSSVALLTIGIGMFILILSGPNGYFSPIIGFLSMTAAFIFSVAISIKDWPHYDEMMRKVTIDSTYLCAAILFTIIWFWSSATWIGWVMAPSPLILLAMFFGIYLISTFIIAARMGLAEAR